MLRAMPQSSVRQLPSSGLTFFCSALDILHAVRSPVDTVLFSKTHEHLAVVPKERYILTATCAGARLERCLRDPLSNLLVLTAKWEPFAMQA